MRTSLFFLLVLAISVGTAPGQTVPRLSATALKAEVDALLNSDEFENAIWGIAIVDLENGSTVYTRNHRKSFMPASNMKLYTTAAALELLGPDWQYETGVYVQGEVNGGTLE
jgi:serine-type D-Ala-D-Ala carboxypeptidase/endopeptidase (penicillin-binding protein 4)